MLVGLCADSHDNLPQIKIACERLVNIGVGFVLHAGDIISPFAAKLFAGLPCGFAAVYGNNDGERNILPEILDITPGGRRLEVGGRTFFIIHDEAAIGESELDGADVLVFGHTHESGLEKDGRILKVNPGEICGYLSGKHSFAVYNTESGGIEFENW